MLSSTAIVSLACLLSTGEVDPAKLTAGLSDQELAKVQEIVDGGACLPEKFSKLINKLNSGAAGSMTNSPTSDFASSFTHSPTSDY